MATFKGWLSLKEKINFKKIVKTKETFFLNFFPEFFPEIFP